MTNSARISARTAAPAAAMAMRMRVCAPGVRVVGPTPA